MKCRLLKPLAAGLTALALTGCSLFEPVDISDLAEEAPEEGAKVIRLANVYESAHPANSCGTATMKKELSKHGIDLKVYPASQLGTEAELVEQVATGALDIGISSGAFFGVWYPKAEVVDGPFLFEDANEYDSGTRGQVLSDLYDDMAEETGLRVFSSWYYGARNVTANKPVRTPDDFKGLKIRTPDARLYLQMINTFGGTATPMALTEVYLALQQNTIDAQENPLPTIDSNKFQEVQSTVSMTKHIVQGIQLVANESFFEGLEPEEADAVRQAADKARLANFKCVTESEENLLSTWKKDKTMDVVEDVDVEEFRGRIKKDLLPKVAWAEEYEAIQKELASGNAPKPAGAEETP